MIGHLASTKAFHTSIGQYRVQISSTQQILDEGSEHENCTSRSGAGWLISRLSLCVMVSHFYVWLPRCYT